MIDGLTDGIWLMNAGSLPNAIVEHTSFGILQAARLRVSKTEYISCPGCGRTLLRPSKYNCTHKKQPQRGMKRPQK